MMVKMSRVEIVIFCGGGAEVLAAAPFVGAVLGPWGLEKTEGSGVGSTEADGEMLGLRVLEPEAPKYAPLEGAAHQHEYWQLAGPQFEREESGA